MLTQVFLNLLSNAVKFVAPGIKPEVQVYSKEGERNVRFFVKDNGIGRPVGHPWPTPARPGLDGAIIGTVPVPG